MFLQDLLTLKRAAGPDSDLFAGPPDGMWMAPRTFGGTTVAQALMAGTEMQPKL